MENNLSNIAKAINNVAKSIKGIDKDMTVGSGNYSYKGVSDQEVKLIVGRAMQENGLVILPTSVDPKVTIDRWSEESTYNGKTTVKQKQQIFTEVSTKYLLLHESGESIELAGYGHGVDAQDKAAGKATTYALKYALLYSFLVATGKIDDADVTHSEETEVPQNSTNKYPEDKRPWLSEKAFNQAMERIEKGETGIYEKIDEAFRIKKDYRNSLKAATAEL